MEQQSQAEQNISVYGRKNATVSGVSDVKSFDENGIIFATCAGPLAVDGEELRITRLDLDRGEADFVGKISGFMYADSHRRGRKRG